MKKQHHSQTSKKTSKKTVKYKFDAKDSSFIESTMTSPKGNKNIFKIINDKNEPDFKQRITE